jgi:hypothetical protein
LKIFRELKLNYFVDKCGICCIIISGVRVFYAAIFGRRRRMKKIILIISAVFVVFFAQAAAGETFMVELSGLVGDLPGPPNSFTAAFDFGTEFISIDEVRIQASGTYTPGQNTDLLDVLPVYAFFMSANPGYALTSLFSSNSPFYQVEETFGLYSGADWDFLLDGTGIISSGFNYGGILEEVVLTPPTAQLSEVYLIVEGVEVPEPATMTILLLGGLVLAGKKKRA